MIMVAGSCYDSWGSETQVDQQASPSSTWLRNSTFASFAKAECAIIKCSSGLAEVIETSWGAESTHWSALDPLVRTRILTATEVHCLGFHSE